MFWQVISSQEGTCQQINPFKFLKINSNCTYLSTFWLVKFLKVKISAAAILIFCVLIHLGVLLKNNNKCWIKNPSLLFKNWLKLEKYPSFMIFFLKTIFFSKFYDEYVPNWVFPLINMHMIYKNQLVATYQLKPSTRDARQVCHFLKKKLKKLKFRVFFQMFR